MVGLWINVWCYGNGQRFDNYCDDRSAGLFFQLEVGCEIVTANLSNRKCYIHLLHVHVSIHSMFRKSDARYMKIFWTWCDVIYNGLLNKNWFSCEAWKMISDVITGDLLEESLI